MSNKWKENITELVTTVDGLISILTYFKCDNRTISILLGIIFIFLLALIIKKKFYKNKYKNKLLIIDDTPIELLLIANKLRTKNKTLKLNKAIHEATICQKNLSVYWHYEGICIDKKGATYLEYSIQGDINIPFEELNCFGYDRSFNSSSNQKIPAILKSKDGLCKKVILPFNHIISQGQNFNIDFFYNWNDCMKMGEDYYISTLSFKEKNIYEYEIILKFEEINPSWVRVYSQDGKLLNNLPLSKKEKNIYIYIDKIENPSATSCRIYKFFRKENATNEKQI